MGLEERGERFYRRGLEREVVDRDRQFAIFLELDEHAAQLGHLAPFDQPVAQLAGLERRCGVERPLQRSVVLD